MIIFLITAIVWLIDAQQPPFIPPQNINGTFGLQLNSEVLERTRNYQEYRE
uniref:Uncharacterized protein n=1 Tax=Meloidogyne enterolobii TaxID=390850 RepID=A0A6V7VF25_MELEN|nr:unnamed protein product [Meloidogyne enterolobii]